jgi:hypothetical protein
MFVVYGILDVKSTGTATRSSGSGCASNGPSFRNCSALVAAYCSVTL